MGRNNLIAHQDFNKLFEIHTNVIDLQLGAVISQEVKPIAFYNIKQTVPQKHYPLTEK